MKRFKSLFLIAPLLFLIFLLVIFINGGKPSYCVESRFFDLLENDEDFVKYAESMSLSKLEIKSLLNDSHNGDFNKRIIKSVTELFKHFKAIDLIDTHSSVKNVSDDFGFHLEYLNNSCHTSGFRLTFPAENESSSYLLSKKENSGILELIKVINGKTSTLKSGSLNTFDLSKDERLNLRILIFTSHLMVFERSKLLFYYDKLGKRVVKAPKIKLTGDHNNDVKISYIDLTSKNNSTILTSIKKTNLLKDIKNYSWNIFAPFTSSHSKEETVYIQRVKRKNMTKRAFLLPVDSRIKWDVFIPKDCILSIALSAVRKHIKNPNDIEFLISITSKGGRSKVFRKTLTPENYFYGEWQGEEIDLSEFSGKECKIEFSAKLISNLQSIKEIRPITLWGEPLIVKKQKKSKPNIVLISLDTLRADHLSSYGYERKISPNIDKFAQNNVLFKNTISSASHTLPSHRSLFTGFYASGTGYNYFLHGEYLTSKLLFNPKQKLFSEFLKDNGYYTAAFTGSGYVSALYGFDRGFDFYWENSDEPKDAGRIFSYGSNFIKNNKDKRFFLFLHTYEIHTPYTKDDFITEDMKGMERVIAAYDSGIKYTDEKLGFFLDRLEKLDMMENTIVIITSDHGERFDLSPEELKDHPNCGVHGFTVKDSEIKIPLIIGGGDFSKKAGKRITTQVRSIDILPTVLDILDIKHENKIRGRSLIPVIESSDNKSLPAFSEAINIKTQPKDYSRGLRYDNKKIIEYIYSSNGSEKSESDKKYELFDLEQDTLERKSIFKSGDAESERFIKALEMIIKSVMQNFLKHQDDSPLQRLQNSAALEQLRNLGYIN